MEKLGGFIYRYRKWVLALWILLIGISGVFALKLPSVLSGNGFEYKGEYNETRKLLERFWAGKIFDNSCLSKR